MLIQTTKDFAKRSLIRAIVLITICLPLAFGSFLKFVYFLPKNENMFINSIFDGLKSLVTQLFQNFQVIEYLWPYSPNPNSEQLLTSGNIVTLAVMIGLIWGFASLGLSIKAFNDLSKARRGARHRKLEDEYLTKS